MKRSKRAVILEQEIRKNQDLYYNKEPVISDGEFDLLWDELRLLEPDNELFQAIPQDSDAGFAKAAHIIPMGSQEKAGDPQAFQAWAGKHGFTDFIVQYKLDGASLELQYRDGLFIRAVTRGDGRVGDDITSNAQKMSGVPAQLSDKKFSGGIRGEVLMYKSVHKDFFSDKANCRNAANGLMKRKDGNGCEHLHVICYDAAAGSVGDPFTGYTPFTTEREKMAWLVAQGFELSPTKELPSIESVIAYRSEVSKQREDIPFIIDGLVIKQDRIDTNDLLRARPEKQIAFKFNLERAVSVLRDVEWSESGATYTPVALIDSVQLAGTRVKRASLANPNVIQSMNLMIGSVVEVSKRGEIIPKIESLVENPPSVQPIIVPTQCMACLQQLVNEGTRLYCPNPVCPKRLHHRLEKWAAVLDIRDLGTALLRQLFDSRRVQEIADLYTLTIDDLKKLDRMGEKSGQNVLHALQAKKAVSLEKFIAGFDIDGIGETMMQKLVESGFNSLEKLFAAEEAAFSSVHEFGPVLAHTLVEQLAVLRPQMERLVSEAGLVITAAAAAESGRLHGKRFCFTGELTTMKRTEAESLVRAAGGTAKSSVTKDLTFLVTNTPESGSAKNKKARSLGIPIITEKAFLTLLHSDADG